MLFGLSAGFILIFALVYHNWLRARIQPVRELIPNCLLTTHPLVFVTGKRSLFYFLGYWNQIPHWLASHGYEVFQLSLPWSDSQKRVKALSRFLDSKSQSHQKFHLLVDASTLADLSNVLKKSDFECLASVTLIGSHSIKSETGWTDRWPLPVEELTLPEQTTRAPLTWLLHQLWTLQRHSLSQLGWKLNREQGTLLLQRAQFLAERDLLQGQRSPNLKA